MRRLLTPAVLVIATFIGTHAQVAVKPEAKSLQSFVGRYELKADLFFDVTVEEDTLRLKAPGVEKVTLVATSDVDFGVKETPGATLTFNKNEKGEIDGLTLHQDGDHKAKKVAATPAAAFDPSDFEAYVGEYEVQPGFVIIVTNEKGKLMAQPTGDDKAELKHESGAQFISETVGARLTFVRDDKGLVTGIKIMLNDKPYEARKIK
jgi:hypothetical protein